MTSNRISEARFHRCCLGLPIPIRLNRRIGHIFAVQTCWATNEGCLRNLAIRVQGHILRENRDRDLTVHLG